MSSRLCFCYPRGTSSDKRNKVGSDASFKQPPPKPLLVELFTSQGCSSCPPADLLLSKLGQHGGGFNRDESEQIPVIALAYHVDYWDYLGWKDPFANSRWSSRQRAYGEALQQDSIYTPEVVIQGRAHCIGSNEESVYDLIDSAFRFPAPELRATFTKPSLSELQLSLSVSFKAKVEGSLDVVVAVYENGLVTDCTKGENRGRVLTNDFVVRSLEKACALQTTPTKKPVQGQVTVKLWEGYTRNKCGVVVFLQNPSSMEVFGVQRLELPEDA